ncbi:hypothetical protein PENTCL1PPCAC_11151 [Pristionchus entomophagus]|uniref:Ribosomal protein n=1 Tax=Pristionchus entomophagus TaxID=358040 RepID=A0AAV5T056_9BILA|nr:hypothetical protein PENTCL1PPCAC_11151 [Pristionchus entomophagus]
MNRMLFFNHLLLHSSLYNLYSNERRDRSVLEHLLVQVVVGIPFLLPPVLRLGNEVLGLVHAQLLGGADTELVQNGLHLLDDVSVDDLAVFLSSALDLDGLEESDGERVVVDATARTKSSLDHFRVGDDVEVVELGQGYKDLPSIDLGSAEIVDEVLVELLGGPLLHDVVLSMVQLRRRRELSGSLADDRARCTNSQRRHLQLATIADEYNRSE